MTQINLTRPDLLRDACYIGGEWVGAGNGPSIPVSNPSTGKTIVSVPKFGRKETEAAIASAEAALPAWSAKTGKERAAILLKWSQLMMQHQKDLAAIMTSEQGKPVTEAAGEIAYAASFLEWFAEEAKRIDGDVLQSPKAGQRLLALKQPIGVTAAITPWNFPAAMITRKVAPALAAGCAIVIKPAELTPLSAFALAELAHRAGIPAGVLQVITGDARTIGAVLTGSPVIRKLSFTGSTEVGRILMAQSAPTVKRLSLELGGNAPFIVFDDADVDAAVEGALAAKYRNGGQTCVCANRFYIQDGIYDAFAAKFAERTGQLRVGNGLEAGVTVGPLIEDAAIAKVASLVEDATSKGGRVLVGGGAHALGGTFYTPTVIADATAEMRLAREEIFGPVAPLFRFKQDDEAIAAANATEYGLAAYLYTRDIARAWRTAEALEYGMVGLNTGLISNEVAPFGGIKQSGIGREGSRHGIEEYLEIKYLCLQM